MALSDKTGLTIKIGADVANAKKGIDDVRTSIGSLSNMAKGGGFEGLASGLLKIEGGLGAVAGPLAAVTAGIGAVAGVAATAIGTMFALAQGAAEYGSKIYDAHVQTGLATDTLEALNLAASQSGADFGQVVQSTFKFSLNLKKLGDDSEESAAKMKKLGLVKSDLADLDGAFAKVALKINETGDAITRNNIAAEAFGARGAKTMIGVFEQMGGDIKKNIENLRAMGLLLGEENVRQADKFDDRLKLLSAQFDAIKNKVGAQLMPAFSALFSMMSSGLAENQKGFDVLGQSLVTILANIVGAAKAFAKMDTLNFGLNMTIETQKFLADYAIERARVENTKLPEKTAEGGGAGGGDKAKKDAAAKKARDERIKALELEVKQILDDVKEADRMLADEMAKRETAPGIFREPTPGEVQASIENAIANLEEFYSKIRDARAKIAIEKMGGAETPAERLNIEKEFQLEDTALMREYQDKKNKILADGTARYNDIVKKGGEATLATIRRGGNEQLAFLKSLRDSQFLTEVEYLQAKLQIDNQLIDAEIEVQKQIADAAEGDLEDRKAALDKIKDLNSQKVINEIETQNAIREAQKKPQEEDTPLEKAKKSWEEYFETIKEGAGSVEGALGTLGMMGVDMLQNMEGALKSSISNWILYGDSVGKALKKALAAQLASVAAEAAVWALKAAALGFYLLAIHDYSGAASAFKSAAVWGAVAVLAGVTARALAKGSFENEANRATAGGASTNRNTEGQGQAFSSQGNQTINASQSGVSLMPTAEIVIRDASGMFSQLFEAEIRNNSRVRRLIIDTANS